MITLKNVYREPDAAAILYDILRERSGEDDPHVNISHRKLPSMREHLRFLNSKPYHKWFLIQTITDEPPKNIDLRPGAINYVDETVVGTCYITRHNEIGIMLLRKYRGRGLGMQALTELVTKHKPLKAIAGRRSGRFLANINPKNARSIRLFEKVGFSHLSNTYQL